MDWFVIYTKPRWEKKVAQELEKVGIEAYCPTVTEIRQWSDRKKKVISPLFKSYVFVQLPGRRRNDVFQIPGVIRYLFWLNKPAIVKEKEIETIKEWLSNDAFECVETRALSPGDNITICKGSFKGQEAVINEIGKKRLRLIIKSMNMVVNVKIKDVLD